MLNRSMLPRPLKFNVNFAKIWDMRHPSAPKFLAPACPQELCVTFVCPHYTLPLISAHHCVLHRRDISLQEDHDAIGSKSSVLIVETGVIIRVNVKVQLPVDHRIRETTRTQLNHSRTKL